MIFVPLLTPNVIVIFLIDNINNSINTKQNILHYTNNIILFLNND